MKHLTAFEAPTIRAHLVPVQIPMRARPAAMRDFLVESWNARVLRWHRSGGQA